MCIFSTVKGPESLHLQIGLLVPMLPLAVGAAHVLSGSCLLHPASKTTANANHTLANLLTRLPPEQPGQLRRSSGVFVRYLHTHWLVLGAGSGPYSEPWWRCCVPGSCLHSAQQRLDGYLPVAKQPPIGQLQCEQ